MVFQKSLLVVIAVSILGCSTMPGNVGSTKSTFDGSTEVKMKPGFIYSSADFWSSGSFQIGLFWKSTMPNKKLMMLVDVPNMIANIESHNGLQFNIDGEIISLSSNELFTQFESEYNSVANMSFKNSMKSFPVDISLVERMLGAQSVKVKLNLSKHYLEGDFKADKPSAAIRGFKEFLEKYKAVAMDLD